MNPAVAAEALYWANLAPALGLHLAAIAGLLIASAFFAGSESALFSLYRYTMDQLTDESTGARGRALSTLLAQPRKLLATLRGHHKPVCALAWSASDDYIFTAGQDGYICQWFVSEPTHKMTQNANFSPIL